MADQNVPVWGTPVSLGTAGAGGVITTAVDVPNHAMIVVIGSYLFGSSVSGDISDSASNFYAEAAQVPTTDNTVVGAMFYSPNVGPLPAGSSITSNQIANLSTAGAMLAFYVSTNAIWTSDPYDVNTPNGARGLSSVPSGVSSAASAAVAGELFVGALCCNATGGFIMDPAWSDTTGAAVNGSSVAAHAGVLINPGTGIETFNPTGPSSNWVELIASFKLPTQIPNQETVYINYNTDQFTDPYNGYTVQDDGSATYTSPYTGFTYLKTRTYNGMYTDSGARTYQSYSIALTRI